MPLKHAPDGQTIIVLVVGGVVSASVWTARRVKERKERPLSTSSVASGAFLALAAGYGVLSWVAHQFSITPELLWGLAVLVGYFAERVFNLAANRALTALGMPPLDETDTP